jgi:hypothetical protein
MTTSVRWRRVPRQGSPRTTPPTSRLLTSDVSAHPPICELPKESSLTLLPEPVDRVGFVPDEPLAVLDGDPRSLSESCTTRVLGNPACGR